jgi:hypothetical protein
MTDPLFASSTTYIRTVYMFCSKCNKLQLHRHVWEYPPVWACTRCDTFRLKEDDHGTVLSTGEVQPKLDNVAGEDHLTPLRSILSGFNRPYGVAHSNGRLVR